MGELVWEASRPSRGCSSVAGEGEPHQCIEGERGVVSSLAPAVVVDLPFGARAASDPLEVREVSWFSWTARWRQSLKPRESEGRGLFSGSGTWVVEYARLLVLVLGGGAACWWLNRLVLDASHFNTIRGAVFLLVFTLVQFFGWLVLLLHGIGFVRLHGRHRLSSSTVGNTVGKAGGESDGVLARTAIVMPVYHESVPEVERRIRAMLESFREAGLSRLVEFYVLSDSVREIVQLEEDEMVKRLESAASSVGGASIAVQLVRRPNRDDYKAGNVRHFLEHHGSAYDYFFVLDADSLISGKRLLQMIRRMEREPRLGILQASVLPLGGRAVFTRVWQSSLWRTTPLFCAGLEWVMGNRSVYWGHNALIRLEPFFRHARLPILPGRAPLGGRILSQDIVEAALMGRAGYDVAWEVEPGGSFDEIPPDVIRYGERDRRWYQGNLQHFSLVFGDRFRLMHRLYFVYGIVTYLMSALIVGLLAYGLVDVAFISAPAQGEWTLWLLLGSVPLLQWLPKMLGFVYWFNRDQGLGRQLSSSILDIVCSALIYPSLMFLHCRFLAAFLCGRTVEWGTQGRNHRGCLRWREAVKSFWLPTLIAGLVIAVSSFNAPQFLVCAWLLLLGWLFSIPLAVWSSSPALGERLGRYLELPISTEDSHWLRGAGLE